jgi:2-C-methyl-D-erythritol 2,4-cyclodiphosphate synthase
MTVRVGQGWDIHRLVAGRPLRLGGITVPFARGLLGHSDGDVVLHAVSDALLGAVGAGDIGTHFPDSDPQYRGVDSAVLLQRVVELAAARGYAIGNIDVTIVAQEPRLGSHLPAMRDRVAALTTRDVARVNLKVKSGEGLDAVGRGEAIAAMAVALLEGMAR